MVHQDAAHNLDAHRREMRPAFAGNFPGAHQLEVRIELPVGGQQEFAQGATLQVVFFLSAHAMLQVPVFVF
jgi:hypothetical protein